MAKPIKETPILRGEDAQRFVKEIEKAEKEKVSSETATQHKAKYNLLKSIARFS